ncbi:uncharacterized protein TNCV_782831 [Trichonephila clavipes]|nr:uncharacterized protein TNCV_782831 [Trichonephila clavipes]
MTYLECLLGLGDLVEIKFLVRFRPVRAQAPLLGEEIERKNYIAEISIHLYEAALKGSFAMREKEGNRLVPGPAYMVDALNFPNKLPGFLTSQYRHVWPGVVLMEYNTCWQLLDVSSQSLASNGPVVDNRDLNLVFRHTKVTHNKLFLSSPTKCAVERSWLLVLLWPPFELLHHSLTTIVFAQYIWWLTYGNPKTVRKLGEQGNKAVLGWVMKEGLIPSRYECLKCKKDMLLVERKGTIDGFEWRCRVRSKENPHFVCRSVRKGMWFSHSRLGIRVILRLTSGTGLELVTKPATIRYLEHSATAATLRLLNPTDLMSVMKMSAIGLVLGQFTLANLCRT